MTDTVVLDTWEGPKSPRVGIVDGNFGMEGVKSWKDVGGWFSEEDAEFVGRFWRDCDAGDAVVEMGLWTGRSTCFLGGISKDVGLRHFAIDDWRGADRTTAGEAVLLIGQRMQARLGYDAALRTLGLESAVQTITFGSHDTAKFFSAESVSCVFIDACHHGPSIMGDVAYWWRPLKAGCVMCGHDYVDSDGNPNDVTRFIDAFVKVNGLALETGGCCWALRKCAGPVKLPDTDGVRSKDRPLVLN